MMWRSAHVVEFEKLCAAAILIFESNKQLEGLGTSILKKKEVRR
jgi:hypothetical protein